ncbi:MAG: hypothetical protein QOD92_1299 [Acidimicrobiaceae bacterium]|jgi:hypothetical protein
MMRRAVFLLAALLAGAVMAAPMASAQSEEPVFANDDDYAALCIPLTVSNSSPAPGDHVTVSGTAATGGADIFIVLNGDTIVGTTTSDPTNHFFSADVVIPADAPSGGNTLQAFQAGDNTDPIVGCPAQVAALDIVRPAAAAAAEEEPLARTGANSTMPLARLGFGLLAAGGLAMLVSRRHKSNATARA